MKGNGTSAHSATNGRVWVEWVKAKSIRHILRHPSGPGVLEVSQNTRHRGLRQCVYPLADSDADHVTCGWVAPAHDPLAWAQMQMKPSQYQAHSILIDPLPTVEEYIFLPYDLTNIFRDGFWRTRSEARNSDSFRASGTPRTATGGYRGVTWPQPRREICGRGFLVWKAEQGAYDAARHGRCSLWTASNYQELARVSYTRCSPAPYTLFESPS